MSDKWQFSENFDRVLQTRDYSLWAKQEIILSNGVTWTRDYSLWTEWETILSDSVPQMRDYSLLAEQETIISDGVCCKQEIILTIVMRDNSLPDQTRDNSF